MLAARERLAGTLVELAEFGFDFVRNGTEEMLAFAMWDSTFALDLLPECSAAQWVRLVFRAKADDGAPVIRPAIEASSGAVRQAREDYNPQRPCSTDCPSRCGVPSGKLFA